MHFYKLLSIVHRNLNFLTYYTVVNVRIHFRLRHLVRNITTIYIKLAYIYSLVKTCQIKFTAANVLSFTLVIFLEKLYIK